MARAGDRTIPAGTFVGIVGHMGLALGFILLATMENVRADLLGYLFGDVLALSQTIWPRWRRQASPCSPATAHCGARSCEPPSAATLPLRKARRRWTQAVLVLVACWSPSD